MDISEEENKSQFPLNVVTDLGKEIVLCSIDGKYKTITHERSIELSKTLQCVYEDTGEEYIPISQVPDVIHVNSLIYFSIRY